MRIVMPTPLVDNFAYGFGKHDTRNLFVLYCFVFVKTYNFIQILFMDYIGRRTVFESYDNRQYTTQ